MYTVIWVRRLLLLFGVVGQVRFTGFGLFLAIHVVSLTGHLDESINVKDGPIQTFTAVQQQHLPMAKF